MEGIKEERVYRVSDTPPTARFFRNAPGEREASASWFFANAVV
jgi:hypothetical protein